ncbi:MAG: N-acetylmuramic acid 6-phosphate etherase [Acidobacteriales bacterium]|nr:N-acetylmuramic acid 6-phosphate etherase [Terriglobales bacterium]
MKKPAISRLATERLNRASAALDTLSAIEIARIINHEDAQVASAVRKALPRIALAIEAIAAALGSGGRLIYVGAGTSGRIAALDAAECPPTFDTDPKTVQYVIAGGDKALTDAAEYNEDSCTQGAMDIAKRKPGKRDVVVGLSASGRTPYTIAALQYARRRGARTVAVVCNRGSELGQAAHIEIVADVGAEVLSGSTRMKAGTAQKMICNMLTTGAMASLGRVYGNLMVNVHVKNEKLWERGLGILMTASGASRPAALCALRTAGNQVPAALVMLLTGCTAPQARGGLKAAKGNVRRAIELLDTL